LKEKMNEASNNAAIQADLNEQLRLAKEKLVEVETAKKNFDQLYKDANAALKNSIDNCNENARMFFVDAGEWARHYSIVRMTVATFVITTCIAILALKWGGPSADSFQQKHIIIAVSILWLLGAFIFWTFTYHTMREFDRQLKRLPDLPDTIPPTPKPKHPSIDMASFAIFGLTLGLAFILCDCYLNGLDINHFLIWSVFAATLVGLVFPFFLYGHFYEKSFLPKDKTKRIVLLVIFLLGGVAVLYWQEALSQFYGQFFAR
jgi:hypothetical protein